MLQPAPIVIEPEAAPDLVAVMVHGRGRSAEEMRDLALALELASVRFVMPAAAGGSWYPQSFLAEIAANEPALSTALGGYAALVESLIAGGTPATRIVLAGFSQGACLTAEFLARHPRRFAAALILTGGLIGPAGTRWPDAPALAGTPVYLTTAETDAWVPPWRVRETAAFLRANGAIVQTEIFAERDHVVSAVEIARARQLLIDVIAGRDPR